MNLSDLLSKGLVEKFQSDQVQIKNEMDIAKNDLTSAKKMLTIQEWGWAHNAAYNAMLQAGRALMFSKGYRPKSSEHHVAVVSFAETVYAAKFTSEILQAFGKARLRRSESMYDRAGSISETQGRNLVEKADIFVNKAKELLKL
ncbi:MAG: hypothetical protein CO079_07075 [Nitrosopumilales archaeon CG_4_9_14_0_8_um_filter_34_10]|nr:MAG: hypothetical protein CO079_07075 [Nitrosopumilales archaeon CG_4_9_14_0_8_um_filter_34_10]